MLKKYFLATAFLVSSAGYSQIRHKKLWNIEGFSVKTDVLSLASSFLDKEIKSGYLAGELYFKEEYSLSAELGVESENRVDLDRIVKRIGSQFRWYLVQDDCNCSAFFVGSYFSFEKVRQSVDHTLLNNKSISYGTSSLEAGLTGGLQALVARHFVVDPAVQIGMKFPHEIYNTETRSRIPDTKDKGLLLQILLGIGYRF